MGGRESGGVREPMAAWNHPCMVAAPPQQPISYLHYRLSTSLTIALREISRWAPRRGPPPPAPDRAASGNRLDIRKQNIQYRRAAPSYLKTISLTSGSGGRKEAPGSGLKCCPRRRIKANGPYGSCACALSPGISMVWRRRDGTLLVRVLRLTGGRRGFVPPCL